MENLSGKTIREDIEFIESQVVEAVETPITEKFVKEHDPSVAVGEMLEDMSKSLSYVRGLYNNKARDRNMIVDPVLKEIKDMQKILGKAVTSLHKNKHGTSDPEDSNRGI